MQRIGTGVVAVLLLLVGFVAYAASPTVQQMLPGKSDVKGFGIMPDSLVYGKGNDLTKIYDGGFEVYTKHGVTDAARQMYKRGNDYVEVTIHTLGSDQSAFNFLKYWQDERKAKSITRTKTSMSFMLTKPNVMQYAQVRNYLVTVSAFYSADKAQNDVKAFTAAIEKKIISRHK